MPFRYFDHTGDIGIDLWAGDLPGLFAAAAAAFTETLTAGERVERRTRATVSREAGGLDLLLLDWVSELVYRFDAFAWLTRQADVRVARRGEVWALYATLEGERRDPGRHPLKVLVKAVTYHELLVEETAEGWRARLVLDI